MLCLVFREKCASKAHTQYTHTQTQLHATHNEMGEKEIIIAHIQLLRREH